MSLDPSETSEADDESGELPPSRAPARGMRGSFMKKQPSQSVRNLLGTVGAPDMRQEDFSLR